ncbi:hypothetical protein GTP55_08590 [Duganella sp. FT109W]|uniref:Uncharacterized protein n=1 Tax=Duganella margarita TaxID=2692170 RepID=A0A7X4KFI4_9BURK|nr:hypothetical protein [Duganella margarita]MYM71395.1 hypothetical protein [Duganella margarita]MYN39427.1 hypothetical protein [Duganella margarita]
MVWIRIALAASALALSLHVEAAAFKDVYVDDGGQVHLVTAAGKDLRIVSKSAAINPQLAPDGNSAAWLVMARADAKGEAGANEVRLYRDGKARAIKCEPFIRDFWFWKGGSRIAIDCGGSHFAGRENLYDSATLKLLESFDQATVPTEKRPEWSSSSDRYQPD